MFLYPYKIFALSNVNKRLFNKEEPGWNRGIYDVETMNYRNAKLAKESIDGSYISVLLGEVRPGIYLNCLDLDGYKNEDGTLTKAAKDLMEYFDESELEDSLSGKGGHIYILTTKKYETFKIKKYFKEDNHSDLEFYTDKRHIVTTTIDFENLNLKVDKYNDLIDAFIAEIEEQKAKEGNTFLKDVQNVFDGKVVTDVEQFQNSVLAGRTPVTDMYTLRGCGFKDSKLIELIDTEPDTVNQSDHDAALLRKLMYYTLSFESAHEMAMKTNYYKHKDERHKKKFNDPSYIARTRKFLGV